VTDTILTPYIAAPVTGATGTGYFNGSQYSGTVEWEKTAGGGAHSGPFTAAAAYTAMVRLTAHADYTFDGLQAGSFTHDSGANGTPAFAIDGADSTKGTVTIEFAETDKRPISGPINLTPYLPAPAAGTMPAAALTVPAGSPFTGAVAWKETGGSTLSGNFEVETEYTAMVTLTPAPGYEFASGIAFDHTGGTKVDQAVEANGTGATLAVDFAGLPYVIDCFGSDDTTANSARILMAARKAVTTTAANPLEIDLSPGRKRFPRDSPLPRILPVPVRWSSTGPCGLKPAAPAQS
jgi:hypothetical protein